MFNGDQVLKSEWRHAPGTKSCTAFTLVWNFIAWTSILMSDGDKMAVNGMSYGSYYEALLAHPVTAGVLLFPVIGLFMIYHCLGLWINRTELKIHGGEFIVKRGPLFWVGSEIRIPVEEIKQAYVQEYSPFAEFDKPVLRYRLIVQRYQGDEVVIESEIRSYANALILETWVEKHLQIIDVSVVGEAEHFQKDKAA